MCSCSARLPDSHFGRQTYLKNTVPSASDYKEADSTSLPLSSITCWKNLLASVKKKQNKTKQTSLTDTGNSCSKRETEQELKFVLFLLWWDKVVVGFENLWQHERPSSKAAPAGGGILWSVLITTQFPSSSCPSLGSALIFAPLL